MFLPMLNVLKFLMIIEAFLKKIEEVCTKIHDSKRVILVGALYPMSIAVEFQTDMIFFW